MSLISLSFFQRYQSELDTAIKNYVKSKNPNEKGTSIASGTNLNDLNTFGTYYIADDTTAGGITNLPIAYCGKVYVMDNGNDGIAQFYVPNHTPKLYQRLYWSNAWTDWKEYGTGGGTSDYNDLDNKPSINSVTLSGNKTTSDLNISYSDLTGKPTIPSVTHLSQTLTAGQTSVTFTSAEIKSTSMVDVYTSVAGLAYVSMTGSVGAVTVTFEAQLSDITVTLEIKEQ